MGKNNRDIWVLMIQNGVTQKDIAERMEIRREYLSRVMGKALTDKMRARILLAIDQITQGQQQEQRA